MKRGLESNLNLQEIRPMLRSQRVTDYIYFQLLREPQAMRRTQNMQEYGFSLTHILPYKGRI